MTYNSEERSSRAREERKTFSTKKITANQNFHQGEIANHFYPFAFYILPDYNSLNIRTSLTQEDISW